MGAALNMLAPREVEVSDASLPYNHIGYGTPLPLHLPIIISSNVLWAMLMTTVVSLMVLVPNWIKAFNYANLVQTQLPENYF